MHVHCLLMLLNAFLSVQKFVLVRGCATLPISPSPNSLPDKREIEKERKKDHISQSQRCIGDIGTWQPAISHKHLPAWPSTISSPTSCIDFRLTGVVKDMWRCVCLPVCYGCHVCRAISVLVTSGQLLHPLLMELLTGNKLK